MYETTLSQICIVDDDVDFVEFLGQYLIARRLPTQGFETAEDLLNSGDLERFDFFILDLGLPGLGGIDLIKLIRTRSAAGILVISGRMGPDASNSAISAGADMFVNKPVRFDQVYNAMASVSRQMALRADGKAGWKIAVGQAELLAPNGAAISLSPLELQVFLRLCQDPAQAVPRQDLARAAGMTINDGDRSLDTAIFHLRRKIEKEAAQPSPLKTVHGVGYQIIKSVEIAE